MIYPLVVIFLFLRTSHYTKGVSFLLWSTHFIPIGFCPLRHLILLFNRQESNYFYKIKREDSNKRNFKHNVYKLTKVITYKKNHERRKVSHIPQQILKTQKSESLQEVNPIFLYLYKLIKIITTDGQRCTLSLEGKLIGAILVKDKL